MKYFTLKSVSFVLFCATLLDSCAPSQGNASEEETVKKSYLEKQDVKVGIEAVKQAFFSRELISNGTLTAKEKAVVPFQVNEQIESIGVKEGQQIQAGKRIASINDFTFQKRFKDAINSYNKALIDLEDLLLGYGYALKDTASVSENVLKMCKIRSGFNTAESSLEEAKRNLSYTKIIAPISGVVSNLQAKENNHSSQYKYCCQIIDNSSMEVEFHVLEGELGMVAKGQKVVVFPFALQEITKYGVITSVNPTVENGLIKITAEIPNKDDVLIDGMSVKILVKKEVPNCMVIPKSAVLYRQNRKVVFVYKNGLANWVYVETGMENSTDVCITDGSIKQGDEVIVSNNLNLAHESPVSLSNQ